MGYLDRTVVKPFLTKKLQVAFRTRLSLSIVDELKEALCCCGKFEVWMQGTGKHRGYSPEP